jgi:hypothetical protein
MFCRMLCLYVFAQNMCMQYTSITESIVLSLGVKEGLCPSPTTRMDWLQFPYFWVHVFGQVMAHWRIDF